MMCEVIRAAFKTKQSHEIVERKISLHFSQTKNVRNHQTNNLEFTSNKSNKLTKSSNEQLVYTSQQNNKRTNSSNDRLVYTSQK